MVTPDHAEAIFVKSLKLTPAGISKRSPLPVKTHAALRDYDDGIIDMLVTRKKLAVSWFIDRWVKMEKKIYGRQRLCFENFRWF